MNGPPAEGETESSSRSRMRDRNYPTPEHGPAPTSHHTSFGGLARENRTVYPTFNIGSDKHVPPKYFSKGPLAVPVETASIFQSRPAGPTHQ
ncbi:hypothetical protein THTE_2867 [Thermogutta terrifontis]|uniref:Uncharacterized protein n=1 Tax=Thermogutta terrifontis TaxID=1331910 RepID=A0A286RHN5_9BACT|nr:hypothetical protein THTE_2867 [Thermogutta terrifontis]